MLSVPTVDRYVAARPSLFERAAFESTLGLFLAANVSPDSWEPFIAVLFFAALVTAFVPPIVRSLNGGGETIWPITKRPPEVRVNGPGTEPLPGAVRGGWFIMAAVVATIVGFVTWLVQRDSYNLFLVAAALWIVGSVIQAAAVYSAESAKIDSL